MTYSTNGLIQITDYNGFVSTSTPNVNSLWSTGATTRGYGQTALATVGSSGLVFASNWLNLINTINSIASHQGTTIGSYTDGTPSISELIFAEANLSNNITLIDTSRLNAIAQGSTSPTTATSVSTWSNILTITFTVTFTSDNTARYYFNAGGQIGFTFSHPAGVGSSINQLISDLASDAGTLWHSSTNSGTVSLSGTSYTGVTKIGGQNTGGTTVNTNNGFYSIYPTGSNILLTQYSNYVYHSYSSTFLQVSASYNGAGVLTYTCIFDEVPDGATVSTGTQATLTLRPPSTTYLTNSWGTPAVTTSIVAA